MVRDADGNAKITYTTADVQERVTKAAEFDDAVTRLLDAAVPEAVLSFPQRSRCTRS